MQCEMTPWVTTPPSCPFCIHVHVGYDSVPLSPSMIKGYLFDMNDNGGNMYVIHKSKRCNWPFEVILLTFIQFSRKSNPFFKIINWLYYHILLISKIPSMRFVYIHIIFLLITYHICCVFFIHERLYNLLID